MKITPTLLKFLLNIYGPYFGAAIKITYIADDWHEMHVRMKLRWYNRNILGTHFGGSIYAMVDPQLVLMLMHILGKQYVVWDKAAAVEFVKPGRGTIHTQIKLTAPEIDKIRDQTNMGNKFLPTYSIEVLDEQNEIVARVNKTIYIRKKLDKSKNIEHQSI